MQADRRIWGFYSVARRSFFCSRVLNKNMWKYKVDINCPEQVSAVG